ncbi:histidine kinase [Rufibacter ruber]|uniref:histidine kinase n=1 Tax=Rufibacter ruber TaxID=1783499 RepID=UPI00082CDECA|nr:histidine kinase [Rufibacter ruber]
MNLKNLTPLPIGQQAIIHAALVWAGLTVLDTAFYSYRVATEGYFLFYGNGSPVTVWQRLGETVLRWETLVFLAVAVGVELLYHFVFKWKSIKVFALACVLLSLGTVVVVLLALPPQGSVGAADFLVVFFEVFIYAVLYALTRNLITRQAREAEQRSHHAQAELSTIKAHLNPHFFFNTLNSLYGTAILEKAEKTAQSVEQLAGIMRYVLTEAQEDLTEVANEIKFLQDYLQLQQMRLPRGRILR